MTPPALRVAPAAPASKPDVPAWEGAGLDAVASPGAPAPEMVAFETGTPDIATPQMAAPPPALPDLEPPAAPGSDRFPEAPGDFVEETPDSSRAADSGAAMPEEQQLGAVADAADDAFDWTPEIRASTPSSLPAISDAQAEGPSEPLEATDASWMPQGEPAERWADAYGDEADAIHGGFDSGTGSEVPAWPTLTDEPVGEEPAAFGGFDDPMAGVPGEGDTTTVEGDSGALLDAEWPEAPPAMDPSMMPTPVLGSPLVQGWAEPEVVAPEPEPEPAALAQEGDLGYDEAHAELRGSWGFSAVESPHPTPGTPPASSLAAAEALERVAAQLRSGALRADGYSPALGDTAALAAALSALLGVDARWDVDR